MDLTSFLKSFSLHDNSVQALRFQPDLGLLEVLMEDPIEGSTGHKVLVFQEVRTLHVTGSTTGGTSGFLPGDEVLTVQFEPVQIPEEAKTLIRARLLLNPNPQAVRPQTGLNTIEVVAAHLTLR